MKLPTLSIKDYIYELPEEKIAKYPATERDLAKLLVYSDGQITHEPFRKLPELLPDNALLFFNDTKVIPARILFEKESGAIVEVFLIHPVSPSDRMDAALAAREKSIWKCTIGNLKRWPADLTLVKESGPSELSVKIIDRNQGWVEFNWTPSEMSFAEIIQVAGAIPLPPYINRATEPSDTDRYQTVYSYHEGAVAAPTAGLHFTKRVLGELEMKGVQMDYVTLHVSAGTFLPVKVDNAMDHTMHAEQMIITRDNLINLLSGKKVVAVGTTAMRVLESLFWLGATMLENPGGNLAIDSFAPYQKEGPLPTAKDSINAVIKHMELFDLKQLNCSTSIFIFPGYRFRICEGLITNFHQPGSTLLLLIAAWLGPAWREVYNQAMQHNYRFLSYGDSSLLWGRPEIASKLNSTSG